MIETTLAAADLVTAIPAFWEDLKIPLSILVIAAGVAGAIVSFHKGFGTAAGKLIGGIAMSAIVLAAVGLSYSVKTTMDKHCNGCSVGQYGR
ncbi:MULTISPECIES: hypothetical protein [Mycolicibacterium]|uniref:TrbC/VirB2 family protein n=2 Tax=Mycolicibacterium TaxID=1866885 RepID=A0A1A0W906_MYCPR|nr:hypothetical protein [Mycolicibacterium peregrinum]OBB92925.1 hypothetical protein A5779_21440 [Mycolicibacterium peregrinum]